MSDFHPQKTLKNITERNHDLSRYFIIKKFSDGWLMGSQSTPDTIFFSREQLIHIGYLAPTQKDKWLLSCNSQTTRPRSKVITVPTSKEIQSSARLKDPEKLDNNEIVINELNLDENESRARSFSCPNRDVKYLSGSEDPIIDLNL